MIVKQSAVSLGNITNHTCQNIKIGKTHDNIEFGEVVTYFTNESEH